MLLIDFGGCVRDSFVDQVKRFSPVTVSVSLCPAAGSLAVRVEDGSEVELDIGQMKTLDGIDDASCGSVWKRGSHAHHSLLASRSSGELGLPVLVERRPFRMLAIGAGRSPYRCQRNL